MDNIGWNPEYVYYARAHGKTAQQMMAWDEDRFPGGRMAGFQLWISAAKEKFRIAHPEACFDAQSMFAAITDHKAWDEFLSAATHEVE